MRKKVLIITVLIMLLSLSFTMIACKDDDGKVIVPSDIVVDEEILAEDNSLVKGTDVRIMSYNIQVDAWGGSNREKPKERARRLDQIVYHYMPDVIAFQEVCEKWHGNLTNTFKNTYKMLEDGVFDYTTMAYNQNTVELIEDGEVKYSKHHEKVIQMMRVVVWGVFKVKTTGDIFLVTSTHLDFHPHEETMKIQIDELASFVKEKSAEHNNCPVFACGDYNIQEKVTEDPSNANELYPLISQKTGLVDANYIEGITIVDGENAKYDDAKWDHIYVSHPTDVLKFTIASNKYYEKISDHYPIMVDAKF